MLEKDVEAAVGRHCRKHDVLYYKWSSPAKRGVPDRILIFPNGLIRFMELKRPGLADNTSPHQDRVFAKLKDRNHVVYIVDTPEVGKYLVDQWLDLDAGMLA
jgi:hypothetical protein